MCARRYLRHVRPSVLAHSLSAPRVLVAEISAVEAAGITARGSPVVSSMDWAPACLSGTAPWTYPAKYDDAEAAAVLAVLTERWGEQYSFWSEEVG